MKKTSLMVMLLLVGIATTLLMAQSGPKPPDPATMVQHRVEFLTSILNLSQSQQNQATTIFTSAEQSLATIMQNMHTAHQTLDTSVKANDSAGIDQAATTIGNLTAQMTAAHAKAEAAFYQILNSDQQNKFSQLRQHGPGRHGFGMRGPGPGPSGGM